MITPYRIGLLALMLIAASSGYLFHQATTQSQANIASEPAVRDVSFLQEE